MDYYEWLSGKIGILVKELEEQLGREFNYDLEVASGAARHSEAMMRHGTCYHAPKEYLGIVRVELINSAFAHYNNDMEVASGAARHSEAMMRHGTCYHAPKEYLGIVRVELINSAFAHYNNDSIELTIKKIAVDFINSPHHASLRRHSSIGCGLAIREIENGIVLYFSDCQT